MSDKCKVPNWVLSMPSEDEQWDLLDKLIGIVHPKANYEIRRKFMKWVLLGLAGGKCKLCDSKENLEFHHKDMIKRTPNEHFTQKLGRCSDETFWEKIVPEAINECILLCRKCHKKVHRK